jgi:hypothetical protein
VSHAAEPLWKRALHARRAKTLSRNNCGASRLALSLALSRAGADVGLVALRLWTRLQQGNAYLWAMRRIDGEADPPPAFVRLAVARHARRRTVNPPTVVQLCGEGLCYDEATHECAVLGGPTLHFCAEHAKKMVAAAREAGVAARIEMRPPVDAEAGR